MLTYPINDRRPSVGRILFAMSNTLNQVRIRMAAKIALEGLEALVTHPEAPETMETLNRALILLRSAFKTETRA